MELGLRLGDASTPFSFIEKSHNLANKNGSRFSMGLSIGSNYKNPDDENGEKSIQFNLFPGSDEIGSGFDVNRLPAAEEEEDEDTAEEAAAMSSPSPNSTETERNFCGDDDENGGSRKKLRLSKEQSAFLEESFKEHNTLNPFLIQKQKVELAKQLNLRPRQVEVWFQNRRARTKLKQTEVDCEYLKRCCETLTEENKRLHKELQDLRTLKTSNPFYMQLPATTLTMCPSCERVATTTSTAVSSAAAAAGTTTITTTTTTTKPTDPPSRPNFLSIFSHQK